MSKPYAIQLICASDVMNNLEPVAVATKPINERQARPLTRLAKPLVPFRNMCYRKTAGCAPPSVRSVKHPAPGGVSMG